VNFGAWAVCLALAAYLGKEFIDWTLRLYFDGNEDEPAPLLSSTRPLWSKLDTLGFQLWSRLWWWPRRSLQGAFSRLFPAKELPPCPAR
jgi:hypothetical protein